MEEKTRKILISMQNSDLHTLVEKGKTYGDSWKKRGGVGAFMMLARKWDRIENQVQNNSYNIFDAIRISETLKNIHPETLLDDIRDLRCYLMLVESELEEILKDNEKSVYGNMCGDHVTNHLKSLK